LRFRFQQFLALAALGHAERYRRHARRAGYRAADAASPQLYFYASALKWPPALLRAKCRIPDHALSALHAVLTSASGDAASLSYRRFRPGEFDFDTL
jgi:hypothetical protein